VSDILGVLPNGKILAIEVKSKMGKLTKDQSEFINMVKQNGGCAYMCNDQTSFENILQEIGVLNV
jgi:VRR-NUC domain